MPIYLTSAIGITTEFDLFNPIFDAGSELPCKKTKLLVSSASEKDEHLSIKFHQGNNCDSSYNTHLESLNIKKSIKCYRGQPQLFIDLEINSNSIMRVIISNISNQVITKSFIKTKSSSDLQPVTSLENIGHIDTTKRLSHAKRLVDTNKKIVNSIENRNNLAESIIAKIYHITQKIEHILNKKIETENLDELLNRLSELSWQLNISSFTNRTT